MPSPNSHEDRSALIKIVIIVLALLAIVCAGLASLLSVAAPPSPVLTAWVERLGQTLQTCITALIAIAVGSGPSRGRS
jgi:hypothetical protein